MAERRMFAKTIIDSDAFLDMPLSAQALYFHLSMRADDDGFVNNPKRIQRVIGGNQDDLKLLCAKRFIIPFDSGIVVIKHWRIHNYIQKDRYKPTVYEDEMNMLEEKSNKSYKLKYPNTNKCIQDGYSMDTQVKESIDNQSNYSIDNNSCSPDCDDANNDFGNEGERYEELFEILWSLYPRKRGKSSVSKKTKKAILKIGYDHMARAIDRYKQEVKGKEENFIMYGSTFFNTRYVDYLDENYVKPKTEMDAFKDILNQARERYKYQEQEGLNQDEI